MGKFRKDGASLRRVSREEETGARLGAASQLDAIKSYCEYRGWDVVHLRADLNVSGAIPLSKRKFAKFIWTLIDDGCRRVIVFKLDRLGRSVADVSAVIEEFIRRGVQLVSVSEQLDLGTAMGRAMAHMLAVFAEFERAMGSERMTSIHKFLRSAGRKQSGRIPYGFDEGAGKQLVKNEAEQGVIRRILNLTTRGWAPDRIARSLRDDGIPTKSGGKWHASTIKNILARKENKWAEKRRREARDSDRPSQELTDRVCDENDDDAQGGGEKGNP